MHPSGEVGRFQMGYLSSPSGDGDVRRPEPLVSNPKARMVWPKFSNLEIDFWLHGGRFGITQPSLCLFHDAISIGSPILDALIELKAEGGPSHRTLTFARTSRESALTTLRFKTSPTTENLRIMNIRCDGDAATIEMTDEGLKLLVDAVSAWLAGAEDFGVSPRCSSLKPKDFGRLDRESGELWFWGPYYAAP